MKLDSGFIQSVSPTRSFSENWSPLITVSHVYVPIGTMAVQHVAVDDLDTLLDLLDVSGRELYPGFCIVDVFLEPEAADTNLQLTPIPIVPLLQRLLKNPLLQGVTFHSSVASPSAMSSSYTLYRFAVARLVGLLELSSTEGGQSTAAVELLAQDRLCACLHLSAESREQGHLFEHYFAPEISALLGLGLYQHASQYLRWAAPNNPEDFLAFQAHLLSAAGTPEEALALLRLESDWSWRKELETARALLCQSQAKKALKHFDRCLALVPAHYDPLLGRGISLRAEAWQSLDEQLLQAALDCFALLIDYDGYHSAEAYHHRGTVLMAQERFDEAEIAFRNAIARAPSPVSKRNLVLVLHAQRRLTESYAQYEYLFRYFPEQAKGLEKYFNTRPRLIFIATDPVPYAHAPRVAPEELRQSLRNVGITLRGDLLDFKRVDSYINYYAPGGGFIDSSQLAGLEAGAIAEVVARLGQHLSHLLVSHGYAHWVGPMTLPVAQLRIAFVGADGQSRLISMFQLLLERIRQGAETDSFLTLESLVVGLPEYWTMLEEFVDPFPALPADDERVALFEYRAAQAVPLLENFGILLKGTLEDLAILDSAIDHLLTPHTTLSAAFRSGEFGNEQLLTIGLYLGSLSRKFSGGQWYDHSDGLGISIQEMPLAHLYPVWRVCKRLEAGVGGDTVSNLGGLMPGLVCSELIRKVVEEEIGSFDIIRRLVAERLPNIADPSAIESLASTILYCASRKSQL